MSKTKTVAIIFGGESGEHEVSILSARSILKHIDRDQFTPTPIYIDKQGVWHADLDTINPLLTGNDQSILAKRFIKETPRKITGSKLAHFDEQQIDIAFPILHGNLGEDGTVQGLFDMLNLPYVGADVLGSSIGMDKDISKRLAQAAGIPTANYITLTLTQWKNHCEEYKARIESQLNGLPVFVKPARLGSSVGINKAKTWDDLDKAMQEAFLYDDKILIEAMISCREIELAVLENVNLDEAPIVSAPGEIIPNHEFYSYEAKYVDPHGAQLVIPANLTPEQITQAQTIAQQAFTALECKGMARIDLFWDKVKKQFLFNELNTIPGFTKISMYPKMMAYSGISYTALITRLLELAHQRHQQRQKQHLNQLSVAGQS